MRRLIDAAATIGRCPSTSSWVVLAFVAVTALSNVATVRAAGEAASSGSGAVITATGPSPSSLSASSSSSSASAATASCPRECVCESTSIDCSFRGLTAVPSPIPANTERLDLQGNNLTIIRRRDFAGLRELRILQLLENQIHTLEKGSFDDLVSMERLRLNRNRLTSIPDLLFANMPRLHRL